MPRSLTALLAACCLALPSAVGDAAAQSPAPPPPPVVSLSAPSSLTAPDRTDLIATASSDVGPTPYYVRIYDDDTGDQVTSCSGGTTCQATVSPGSEANADPQDRHFHAEVNAVGVSAKSTSGPVTAVVGSARTRPLLGADIFGPLARRAEGTGGGLILPKIPARFEPPPELAPPQP